MLRVLMFYPAVHLVAVVLVANIQISEEKHYRM